MKKSLFLIGSILGAAALIGGTFAAWAVTDKADPFSVNITPGTLDVGVNQAVTLEWGTKGLVNIENLEMGVEKGPYILGLKATYTGTETFTGNLSAALSTTATEDDKLLNHLTVNVYEGEDKYKRNDQNEIVKDNQNNNVVQTPLLSIATGAGTQEAPIPKSVNKDIQVNSGEEYKVCFYITLDSGLNPITYNALRQQTVTMTVDWNKGSTIQVVTSQSIFFKNTSSWANVKAYAWDSTTGKSSGTWPGLEMKSEKDNIYSIAIESEFDKVIFTGTVTEDNVQVLKQTADLDLPDIDDIGKESYAPYWNGSAWVGAPDLNAETVYYLVGEHNSWTTSTSALMTKGEYTVNEKTYTYKITNVPIAAGGKLKVVSSGNTWYGEGGTSSGDMVIGEANNYNFYFNPTPTGSNPYIFCEAYQA